MAVSHALAVPTCSGVIPELAQASEVFVTRANRSDPKRMTLVSGAVVDYVGVPLEEQIPSKGVFLMPRPRRKTAASKSTSARKTSATRARKTASPKSASTPRPTAAAHGTLVCPECGKTFMRAASLGAHRNRAHGVSGASGRKTTTSSRSRAARTTRATAGLDRDALLRALFPNGIPAKERVIRDVNAWLDQAERLAKLA